MKTDLIAALDVPSYEEALDFVGSAREELTWVKVGLELYVSDGPAVMHGLKIDRDMKVMLDLKLHDIPETVSRAVKQAVEVGADMLTVHASGGVRMLEEAAKAAGSRAKILAVTVLTSLDANDLVSLGLGGITDVREQVLRLAKLARKGGVDGLVCSPQEAAVLREYFPDMILVTPGIRPAGGELGDQKRVATPAAARDAGADFIVVGRPIRDAKDRVAAIRAIRAELG